jgi:microcystin-dependent protein
MSDQFVAEVRIFGFNFPPNGWAFCQGQLVPISQNTALFSLLGTTYGGNGQTNFALPNLQATFPMHPGNGPGLSPRTLGESGGASAVTLGTNEIPAHDHAYAVGNSAPAQQPAGNLVGASPARGFHPGPPDGTAHFSALQVSGGSQPHNNMPPFLTLNFCIALQGVFPARP